jgi:hypothetical protein
MRNVTTTKTALLFDYMGVDSSNLTDESLKKIKEEGDLYDYLARQAGMERGDPDSPFHMKVDKFNRYDKLKLHPEIYKSEIQAHLRDELKPKMTAYVRKQFKGSTQNITMDKIEDSLWHLLRESPTFWHDDDNFKKIFLERFAKDYPLCCDGSPISKAVAATAPGKKKATAPVAARQDTAPIKRSSSKKKSGNTDFIVGVVVFLVIGYILTKMFF